MRKLFITILILMVATPCFAIADWKQGTNTAPVEGTSNASDIDYNLSTNCVDPLDKLLYKYIHGCTLTRTSATVVTVGIGSVTCSDGAGTIKRMRQNTATTTVDMTVVGVGGIDSGSAEAASTWYDVYAVADANATTFTAICASQGTALSDVTYYRYIGSFYNDAGSDIKNFRWEGNGKDPIVIWDSPVVVTTTISDDAWSAGATTCEECMPSSSIYALFGVWTNIGGAAANSSTYVRPDGGGMTGGTNYWEGVSSYVSSNAVSGELWSATSSSQNIDYYNGSGAAAVDGCTIAVKAFVINR